MFCPLQLVHGGLLEAVSQLLDSRCRDIGPTCVRGVHISRGELPIQPSTRGSRCEEGKGTSTSRGCFMHPKVGVQESWDESQ